MPITTYTLNVTLWAKLIERKLAIMAFWCLSGCITCYVSILQNGMVTDKLDEKNTGIPYLWLLLEANTSVMRILTLLLTIIIIGTSCASTTVIHSIPSGAKVYLNDEPVGETPYTHRDTKILGTCTLVRLERIGYETYYTSFCRDEEADAGAIIAGIFFLVPFLWTMKYKPSHTYELQPADGGQSTADDAGQDAFTPVKNKVESLRALKQLLDEGILTEEEYQKEKQKILDNR